MDEGGQTLPRIAKSEHIGPTNTGDNIYAKRVATYLWNPNTNEWERASTASGFSPVSNYDALRATYPSPESEVYEYMTGGVSGTVVRTVTVTYTTSTKQYLYSVEWS